MNAHDRQARSWKSLGICLAIALGAFCVFWPILTQGFIYYDDPQYVLDNRPVREGLTWSSFVWSLSSEVQGNWHPVTMWTHMFDCQLYGIEQPGGHHFTSLCLHMANAILLFWFFRIATGRVAAAAIVAALFAFHPTRVESVAWVSERKDVLSTFFWFSMLVAYVYYTRRVSWWRYAVVFSLLALGLMSKAMLVTAPCLLMLLDIWPLKRLELKAPWRGTFAQLGVLVLEKIPLALLSIIASVITYRVQRAGGFILSWQRNDFGERLINAVNSYGSYILNFLWPTRLALMYPLPRDIHAGAWTVCSAIVGLVLTVLAILWLRKRPYFFVGWFWFLGTLVPVIGLIHVGATSMADRYTYVPMVGLFVIAVWGFDELVARISAPRVRQTIAVTASAIVLLFLAGMCFRQVSFWRDERTLYSRSLDVTEDNYLAHYNYGNALGNASLLDQALEQYELTLALEPQHSATHFNAGTTLARQGRCTEALPYFQNAIRYGNDDARAWFELAYCEHRLNMLREAVSHYQQALKRNESLQHAYLGLGSALARLGDTPGALALYRQALQRWPASRTIAARFIWLFSTHSDDQFRNVDQAVKLAESVSKARRQNSFESIEIDDSLGAAFAAAGRFEEAISYASSAYRLARALRIQAEERGREEGAKRAALAEQAIAARIELYEREKEFRQDPADALY